MVTGIRGRPLIAVLVVAMLSGAIPVWSTIRAPLDGDVVAILLIGSDSGPARDSDPLSGRADALHIVFARTDGSSAAIVNIPRDSWVPVPGRGTGKINTCLLGGPQGCVDTAEALWGVPIDGYVVTGFWGYRDAINAVGGVVMDVPGYIDDGGPPLRAGPDQLLDGPHALTWARDRKHRYGGDFGRTAAQTELLQALHAQLRERARSPVGLARLAADFQRTTVTSFDAATWLKLGLLAVELDPADVTQRTLPASVGWAGRASVVYLHSNAGDVVRAASDGQL